MNKNILAIVAGVIIIAGAFYITGMESENNKIGKTNEQQGEEKVNENSNDNDMNNKKEEEMVEISEDFIACLKEEGVIIYGSSTCPACAQLEQEYGGYEIVKPIYLDCSGLGTVEETERCRNEMKTNVVPEVQINGELFDKWGSPENLAKETSCILLP